MNRIIPFNGFSNQLYGTVINDLLVILLNVQIRDLNVLNYHSNFVEFINFGSWLLILIIGVVSQYYQKYLCFASNCKTSYWFDNATNDIFIGGYIIEKKLFTSLQSISLLNILYCLERNNWGKSIQDFNQGYTKSNNYSPDYSEGVEKIFNQFNITNNDIN